MTYSYSEEVLRLNPELAHTTESKPASKYHNVRQEAGGLRFQSGKEANEIMKLVLLDEKHLIFGLRLQVKFPLQGGLSYTCDACYLDEKLDVHICDVKGMLTKEFKIKAKLFRDKYGQDIELI